MTTLADALTELRAASRVLVISHASPDGDAIGTTLAIKYLLNALGNAEVVCANHDPVPKIYRWLGDWESVVDAEGISGEFDLVVITDVARLERTGAPGDLIPEGQRILVLDHHLEPNPCGTVNFIDPTYASASEIILDLFHEAGITPSQPAAECIYVGLVTDTGNFRFSNTDARAHVHAAQLVEAGVNVSEVASIVFDQMPLSKLLLLRRALETLHREDGYAYMELTQADFDAAGATGEEVEGIVNYARNLDGVHVGVLFRETPEGQTKISLRSKVEFNSAEFLQNYGGGGHAAAAGATVNMPLAVARDRIIGAMAEKLGNIQAASSQ